MNFHIDPAGFPREVNIYSSVSPWKGEEGGDLKGGNLKGGFLKCCKRSIEFCLTGIAYNDSPAIGSKWGANAGTL